VLQVQNLEKSFGVTTVLDGVSFVLNDGERLGLIGPNGSGKSTLLRCLAGLELPDRGSVVLTPRSTHVGYLPQAFGAGETRSIAQVTEECAEEWRARMVLDGLGLGALDPSTPVHQLSGGQKTRLGLATLLLGEPDVLLLDEPTNHLDTDALEWLEQFLNRYEHAVLVVSHDRVFVDATVSRVLYLDPTSRTVRSYVGGYSDFATAREHERDLQQEAWRRQEEYVQRVRSDIGRIKSEARSIELSTTPRQPGIRRHARRKAAVAKSRERKLERYLASDERVDRPRQRWPINLNFGAPPPGSRVMLRLEDVGFAYPSNPPLFEHVSLEVRYGQRLGLIGPNGSGKTTLLRLISEELQPCDGRVQLGAGVQLGVMAQEHETLDPQLTVLETVLRERAMSEQDARSFLPYFLFYGDSVFKPVSACSLGECSRLQLAKLVLQGCNLLLLDEPINHLDVESREHFEAALDAFEGTVIVVAHDRAFLRSFARRLLEVRDGQVTLT
jgi:ATPase subunit of ABC transporter with duplicated ATPase domains